MALSWHGSRGAGRGKNTHWKSINGSRGHTTGPPANVWTPAIAAAAAAASKLPDPRNVALPASVAPANSPEVSAGATAGIKARKMESACVPPAVKARISIRKATETVEASSEQSAAEMEIHLQNAEKRLALVKAQEEEIRAIVDAHLEREAALKTLLEELYREQQEEQDSASASNTQIEDLDPADSEAACSPCAGQATPEPTTTGESVPQPHEQPQPPQQQQQHQQKPQQKDESYESGETVIPSPIAKRRVAPSSSGARRIATGPLTGASGEGPTVAASGATAVTLGGSGGGFAGGGASGLLLAMAMAAGGPGDGVLTRDASTIEDYILLMSDEAVAKDEAEEMVGRDPAADAPFRRQPGLPLSDALNRAETASARPPRPANLLDLAALVRPLRLGSRTKAVGGQSASSLEKRKGKEKAQALPTPKGEVSGAETEVHDGEAGKTANATKMERRRMDPNAIMCPFELNGVCNDDDCRYQHAENYLPLPPAPSSPPRPLPPQSAPATVVARGAPAKGRGDSGKSRPGGNEAAASTLATTSAAAAIPVPVPVPVPAAANGSRGGAAPRWELPAIDFEAGYNKGEGSRRDKISREKRLRPNGGVDFPAETEARTKRPRVSCGGAEFPTTESVQRAKPPGPSGGDFESPGAEVEDEAGVGVLEAIDRDDGDGIGVLGARRGSSSDPDIEDGADFLALETGSTGTSGAGGGSGSESGSGSGSGDAYENDAAVDGTATLPEGASPAALAKAFAQAALGSIARNGSGGGGGRARGRGGGRREERYYKDREEGMFGATASALTEEQVAALEARLEEEPCDDVEGWLLVAIHRLPRAGNSTRAVMNTIGAVARGPGGPLGNVDHAALKPALRALVRGLERGQAEALWILYLRLFAILPGKRDEALGMAEHAVENYPTSRRMWRLYRSMLRKCRRRSLSDEIQTYRKNLKMLLQVRTLGTEGDPTATRATADSAVSQDGDETESGPATADPQATGVRETANSGAKSDERDRSTVGMVAYLVLERSFMLAEAGYSLQAAADALDALGEGKVLRGWDAAAEDGAGSKSLLRAPSGSVQSSGLEVQPTSGRGGGIGTSRSEGRGNHQRLPEGVSEVLRQARRDTRCLLWLTALHLLVMDVFPRAVLGLAERNSGDPDCGSPGAVPFLWSKEWLSPDSAAGIRLSASAELSDAVTKVFMSALQDAGLLPAEDGRGGGWAPPMRVRDALLPSAAEAQAARAGGMAPEPSALAGPPLALALNWLSFCCRRGRGRDNGVRSVALACCRRFQLSRPDDPSTLEHLLLEHEVSRLRSLEDVYSEISSAFNEGGAAAEALRGRSGDLARKGDGGSGNEAFSSPSVHHLEALYCFFRFAEVRLRATALKGHADFLSGRSPSANGLTSVSSETVNATKAAPTVPAAAEAERDMGIGCDFLREALIGMWSPTRASNAHLGTGTKGASNRWLLDDDVESLQLALEGAKASLFRWADDFSRDGGSDGNGGSGGSGGASKEQAAANLMSNARRSGWEDELSAGRQLSTTFLTLWVLGGPSEATHTLDHLLSAESFAMMPPERRRLAWLQRLEAAILISTEEGAAAKDPLQGVKEVVLRALVDPRTEYRPDCATLAEVVASALDGSADGGSHANQLSAGGRSSVSFAYDVLMLYAKRFWEVRGGVDWSVVAEALGNCGDQASAKQNPSFASSGIPGGATPSAACVRALLHWVNWADESESMDGSAARAGDAPALRSSARPYAKMALARHRDDSGLAGIVAALEASTGHPDRAQRILEAALGCNGLCSALWEQRIALEAAFGAGSKDRARATSSAAASKEVLLRLRCINDRPRMELERSDASPGRSSRQASVLPARVAGLILATVSNASSRQETKSLSLQGALHLLGNTGNMHHPPSRPPLEVPRSLFLLTGLVSLSLASNGLTELPSAVGRLLSLRSLDASDNALSALPRSLSKLSGSLRLLRLAGNRLSSPLARSPLADLVSLRVLDLGNNALSCFPEEVVLSMQELRTLNLAGNRSFQRAPPSLTDALPHLEQLTLP